MAEKKSTRQEATLPFPLSLPEKKEAKSPHRKKIPLMWRQETVQPKVRTTARCTYQFWRAARCYFGIWGGGEEKIFHKGISYIDPRGYIYISLQSPNQNKAQVLGSPRAFQSLLHLYIHLVLRPTVQTNAEKGSEK